MGLKIKHGLQPKRRLPILLAYLCLAGGFYLLITIFYPFFSSQLTDPQNNSTTKLAAKTDSEPAKYQLYIPKLDINLPYATGDESVMDMMKRIKEEITTDAIADQWENKLEEFGVVF